MDTKTHKVVRAEFKAPLSRSERLGKEIAACANALRYVAGESAYRNAGKPIPPRYHALLEACHKYLKIARSDVVSDAKRVISMMGIPPAAELNP